MLNTRILIRRIRPKNYHRNLSQNASKERHRIAYSGIAGCVTPGGDFFVPHKGRPLLGCEKLLIQGLPYFRLVLGNETEVQLGDLAGNAMSVTVVSACMLAAITCQQLRAEKKFSTTAAIKEPQKEKKEKKKLNEVIGTYLTKKATIQSEVKESDRKSVSKTVAPCKSRSIHASEVFKSLAQIAQDAVSVSVI